MEIQQINEIVKSQESHYKEIGRIFNNIKKDSTSRKTEKYIAERRSRLTEVFTKASANHSLIEDQEILEEHTYMKSNYFGIIKELYKDAMDYLEQCEAKLSICQQPCVRDPEEVRTNSNNSAKMNLQLYRINQLRQNLEKAALAIEDDRSSYHYKTLLEALQKQCDKVEEGHFNICEEENILEHSYFQDEVFEKLKSDYDNIIERLYEKLQQHQTDHKPSVKLPRIVIPMFMGSYESWSSFYDLFLKIIHEDNSLTDTEKMQYLKTHVKGDAARLIRHLTVCESNYATAWTLLKNRYENERMIITKHIDNILNIQKLKVGSANSLKFLHDTIKENLEAIKNQKIDISSWDPMLTRILSRIWDSETDEKYEQQLVTPNKPQTFSSMMSFLEKRFMCLENTICEGKSDYKQHYIPKSINSYKCWLCNSYNHNIYMCAQFKALSAEQRNNKVKENRKCKQCIIHDSSVQCHSNGKCKHCGKLGHHSLLHLDIQKKGNVNNYVTKDDNNKGSKDRKTIENPTTSTTWTKTKSNMSSTTGPDTQDTTLLATALVHTYTKDGTSHLLRVLCDQGSQASFCTEEVAQLLSYPRRKIKCEVVGIGDETPKTSNYSIEVNLQPRFPSEFKLPVKLIILPKLTGSLPNKTIQPIQAECLVNTLIADPTYYKRGPIDIILGAQEYSRILLQGLHKIESGIIAQDTEFGWILSGISSNPSTNNIRITSMITRSVEMHQLTKFWELEEIPEGDNLSNEDQLCEHLYQQTTERNRDGTYTVRLPIKNSDVVYGNTRQRAAARLFQLERKFEGNKTLKNQYKEFLDEYLRMGHMRKVPQSDYYQGKYYIPHQPVIKEDSLTTKLRVVFDASSKAKSHTSLNSNMYTGPRLQQDLASILLRWRKHRIVFMADIEKMYRFIKVNEQDWKYQRILWRESIKYPIAEYELTTVTYGTASAPYLAVRTLQQLANDEKRNYPIASRIALQDCYVDDILSGENEIKAAKQLQKELTCMLQTGGFNLRKWSSNSAELLESIPNDNQDNKMFRLPIDEARKSLGIWWTPDKDSFSYEIIVNKNQSPTKRFILSEVSKLFDPLGWLAPVIINMKLIIQDLWANGSEWDQPVEDSIKKRWEEIQSQLKALESISIPRWCHYTPNAQIELHGFSDSSEKAYGAVVYCRVIKSDNSADVTLLQAKSKVAPKKRKITLPKLELCAALLLAKLMKNVIKDMQMVNIDIYCWTDSMITLGWIKGEADRWKTFVANRVSEIQTLLPKAKWNYVNTCQNPADVISRGIAPSKLQQLDLWWNGPEWLKNNSIPSTKTIPEICEEIKRSFYVSTEPKESIWERFSSFKKMVRVLSYCYRFIRQGRNYGQLSCMEINNTANHILKLVQKEVFSEEYRAISDGLSLKKGNKLACLDPFIDNDGLLRVGGRLQRSNLPYDQKHPILLPQKHHVTSIIIHDAHLTTLHGGNTLTLAYIRQKYWVLGGKRVVKSYIRKCVKCIRYTASASKQKMGILPRARVTESFPFTHTGVDYAGPIKVRTMKGRGHKSYKGYIAVFVCLATKAIHLELVGDLSTESFIAALRRFMARRGPVSHIYSDNATNFVGAANFLYKELLEITQSDTFQSSVTAMGTQWHFIPPSSPHFGGIWEAGVKSMKHHLHRVIGDQTLTYEELSTFLYQTEACLNSRPLCAQSEDINDNVVLTPSHFLIGREAVGIPDPLSNINTDLLNRWKNIQKMKRDFWKSWTRDYLQQLQQRYKWKTTENNISIGTLVLMKEDNINPSNWPLAKVKEIHKGNDGLVRVVTLKKSSGAIQKRSIHTLIPLPINADLSHQSQTKVNTNITTCYSNKSPRSCRGTSKWLLCLLIMLQLFGTMIATQTYTVKNLSPGFYVENIGTANIDRGMFRIETVYKKERLNEDYIRIESALSKFKQLCDKADVATTDTHCNQFYHHLLEQKTKYERIKEYFTEFHETRRRRGLLGNFLTSVFGVNDEIYRDIDSLNSNQQKLIEASSHQTKIMISAISQVNGTEERIRHKLEGFQTKLSQVIERINSYDYWYIKTNHNDIKIQILQTFQVANNYIDEILSYYNGLLEVYLTKASVYSVLPPKNVSELIFSANRKMPSNIRIVQELLLDTRIVENMTHIQVHAYFPIKDITKYTLIHVTPVPKKNMNNTFESIEVSRAFLAIDYNNELYFELDHEEFKECIQRHEQFLCFPGVVKNMQLNENCIVDQLFKNQTNTKCPTHIFEMSSNIIWKQLCMQNSWLFITKTSSTISIVCDSKREEITIQDVGVIKIADNCIIKSVNNRLAAKRTLSIQVAESFSKQLNFSIYTYISNRSKKLNISKEDVIESSNDFYQHLINEESGLEIELNDNIWKDIQSHTYLVSCVSSIILMTIIIIVVCYGPRIVTCTKTGTHRLRQHPKSSKADPPHPQRAPDQGNNQPSTWNAIYSQPNQLLKPPRKQPENQDAAKDDSIELYQMELPVPRRGQNVHT